MSVSDPQLRIVQLEAELKWAHLKIQVLEEKLRRQRISILGPFSETLNNLQLELRDWMDEVFWARIYAGFHFYHSLEAGRHLGETVAQGVARNHFRAVKDHRSNADFQ